MGTALRLLNLDETSFETCFSPVRNRTKYGYVLNDPVSFADPTGLFTEEFLANHLTPQQQISVGGAEGLIGSGFTWAGYHLASSKVQTRKAKQFGLGLTATGGLLISDGYQNVSRGLLRSAAELEFQARLYFSPYSYANSNELFSHAINSCGGY